jgi:hypothetical protein
LTCVKPKQPNPEQGYVDQPGEDKEKAFHALESGDGAIKTP